MSFYFKQNIFLISKKISNDVKIKTDNVFR